MYIDDGLFVELEIGCREEQSAKQWGEIARGLLSVHSANDEKRHRWPMGRRSNFHRIRD